jgi:hypothetical protein
MEKRSKGCKGDRGSERHHWRRREVSIGMAVATSEKGRSCPSSTCHLACTQRAVCSHQVQERKLQNLHLHRGTCYPLFSSANSTCRRNGGLEPAICHICNIMMTSAMAMQFVLRMIGTSWATIYSVMQCLRLKSNSEWLLHKCQTYIRCLTNSIWCGYEDECILTMILSLLSTKLLNLTEKHGNS